MCAPTPPSWLSSTFLSSFRFRDFHCSRPIPFHKFGVKWGPLWGALTFWITLLCFKSYSVAYQELTRITSPVALMHDAIAPAYKLVKVAVYKHRVFIPNPPLTQRDSSLPDLDSSASSNKQSVIDPGESGDTLRYHPVKANSI